LRSAASCSNSSSRSRCAALIALGFGWNHGQMHIMRMWSAPTSAMRSKSRAMSSECQSFQQ
jgi:hypothetical protein